VKPEKPMVSPFWMRAAASSAVMVVGRVATVRLLAFR
jgi:hypothetical protein